MSKLVVHDLSNGVIGLRMAGRVYTLGVSHEDHLVTTVMMRHDPNRCYTVVAESQWDDRLVGISPLNTQPLIKWSDV